MDPSEMRRRVAGAPLARLATVGSTGRPHVVPVTFALDGERIYFAVDAKPKRTSNLQRLKNIAANPAVSLLVDHYEDDWSRLWWVRVDGNARVVEDRDAAERAIDLLQRKYAQYAVTRPQGPVVAIDIDKLSGWDATG
jgi:PPOX class probable F420-dependent enzyme